MGFFPALASNMINMVGIGPFITIPLILQAMAGPQALLGWICGAALALCDGLVWAELGAAMPDSGGPYEYLRKAFGPNGLGQAMSFLFLWQAMLAGPLTAASGGVGFADYARYLIPTMTPLAGKLLACGVCLTATWLLYRDIRSIGKISGLLWVALMTAMTVVLWGGAWHFSAAVAFDFPPGAFALTPAFAKGLGAATLISMYDYSGYFNVCLIGGEIERPERNIPRVVLTSIGVLAVLYLAMSLSVIGVVPWRDAIHSKAIIADYMEKMYGGRAAQGMTVLMLVIAFASVFSVLLGYTRVPFAAAVEGRFFKAFGRVHPTGRFPSFSVLFMGGASVVMCFLPLDALITTLLTIQILIWFVPQCIGLMLIRQRRREIERPFAMALYPLPVLAALGGWIYIFSTNGARYMAMSALLVVAGVAAYLIRAWLSGQWPFARQTS